ncbi:hypothetical protein FB45DRAFT_874460 [Roridomyces roridus]|uniref:Uncharacterized protein n=1 Tax=Roridomyces roridus TaxID=1738132 RepID=A0AAD7FDE8_9AGAR|nr:hypothetical protein FB45DRAFT_874460 [Roridomyces roridus]
MRAGTKGDGTVASDHSTGSKPDVNGLERPTPVANAEGRPKNLRLPQPQLCESIVNAASERVRREHAGEVAQNPRGGVPEFVWNGLDPIAASFRRHGRPQLEEASLRLTRLWPPKRGFGQARRRTIHPKYSFEALEAAYVVHEGEDGGERRDDDRGTATKWPFLDDSVQLAFLRMPQKQSEFTNGTRLSSQNWIKIWRELGDFQKSTVQYQHKSKLQTNRLGNRSSNFLWWQIRFHGVKKRTHLDHQKERIQVSQRLVESEERNKKNIFGWSTPYWSWGGSGEAETLLRQVVSQKCIERREIKSFFQQSGFPTSLLDVPLKFSRKPKSLSRPVGISVGNSGLTSASLFLEAKLLHIDVDHALPPMPKRRTMKQSRRQRRYGGYWKPSLTRGSHRGEAGDRGQAGPRGSRTGSKE